MSIGIYAFLRIYFLSFGLSAFAQFRTRSTPSSTLHSPDLPARSLVSSADRCSVSSVRARVVPCVACPAACRVPPFRACWGLGSPPAGYTAAAHPRPVSLSTTEKIKKAQKLAAQFCATKNFPRKNKKTPTKGLCSVLYLPYKP